MKAIKGLSRIVIFGLVAAFLVTASAFSLVLTSGTPVVPHNFYGTLTINGNPAQVGTHMKGFVGAEDRTYNPPYTTQIAGHYGSDTFEGKFGVLCDAGEQITFAIEDSPGAGTFHSVQGPECNPGAETNLDLVSTGECTPSPEICDGLDNDCDTLIDEGFPNLGQSCSAGLGVCLSPGVYVCAQGGASTVCSAVAGSPTGTDNNCNGIDENCDGTADNNYTPTPTACGVGACASSGQMICSGGVTSNTCVPGTPSQEVCGNGIDDDCDGQIDEGCTCSNGETRACGSGACTGTQTCSSNQWGACSSSGSDCGTCASCSAAGVCSYDSGQNGDCSSNNILGIATCTNNPDSNPFTWDHRAAFTSQCTGMGTCSTGSLTITHTCSKSQCSAECETNGDCNDQNANTEDVCLGSCACQNTKLYCLEITSMKVLNSTFFQDSTIPRGTMYNIEMSTYNSCGEDVTSMQIVQILKDAMPVNIGTVISVISPGETSVVTVGFIMPNSESPGAQFTAKGFNWNHWIDQNPGTFQILSATSQATFQAE